MILHYRRMHVGLSLFALFIYLFSVGAQAGEPASVPPKDEKPLIYGIHVGKKVDFWESVERGAQEAANKYGYHLIFRGAAEDDTESQKLMFDIAIKSGAKGIFVAPNSDNRAADVIRAKEAGIPVVYIDRMMGDTAPIVSFIGTNNYAAGELAARELIKKMGIDHPVKVVIFPMDKNIVSTSERERGFSETVKKAGYNVVVTPYITSEIGKARSNIRRYLAQPEYATFDAIFTPNETTTIAAILSLNEVSRPYIHIGFDSGPLIETALQDGRLFATVVQKPFEMGYYGVEALNDFLQGKPVKPSIESGVSFITKENSDLLTH